MNVLSCLWVFLLAEHFYPRFFSSPVTPLASSVYILYAHLFPDRTNKLLVYSTKLISTPGGVVRRMYPEAILLQTNFVIATLLRVRINCTSIRRTHLCTSMRTNAQTNCLKKNSGINLQRITLLLTLFLSSRETDTRHDDENPRALYDYKIWSTTL